jgi:ribosomal protein S6--L-glutamate ligase
MKVAVAGIPGAWSSERMCEALRGERIQSFVFSLGDCLHDLNARRVSVDGFDLGGLDGIVVKKIGSQSDPASRLRLHALRELERLGVRIYSRPSTIDVVMDRYRMTMAMIEARLPVPRTIGLESEACLREAVRRFGDAVFKPSYTSKGRGMVRLGTGANGGEPAALNGGRALVQEFIPAPGRDIGACVLGTRFVGAFYRVALPDQWMTTTAAGGTYQPCELPARAIDLAERTAELFGLDYTVVDLVETPDGYRIYEVSAFGGFRGLWRTYQFDVAARYAKYVRADLLG